jgi:glycosyltransferase involved in cell wall biosynthesis
LEGLKAQTLPRDQWELVLIDNASPDPALLSGIDLSWHLHARVARELRLGLTYARLAGFHAARGALLVYVDDDNVLAPNYLQEVISLFAQYPQLGAAGGKSLPGWEVEPLPWVHQFAANLALRDLGKHEQIAGLTAPPSYPAFAPVGAGMALRREVLDGYEEVLRDRARPALLDRCGGQLTSGGDNDIILTALKCGWQVGYFPTLCLTHLIPVGRTTVEYLARLNQGVARSWVQVLALHGIRPWPAISSSWTVLFRKWRAYLSYRAWRDPVSYVRWRGACGAFEGRGDLQGLALGAPVHRSKLALARR